MVKNGHSHGQPQALCKSCGRSVALSHATAYEHLESEPRIFETAVRALAEGNSIRAADIGHGAASQESTPGVNGVMLFF